MESYLPAPVPFFPFFSLGRGRDTIRLNAPLTGLPMIASVGVGLDIQQAIKGKTPPRLFPFPFFSFVREEKRKEGKVVEEEF